MWPCRWQLWPPQQGVINQGHLPVKPPWLESGTLAHVTTTMKSAGRMVHEQGPAQLTLVLGRKVFGVAAHYVNSTAKAVG